MRVANPALENLRGVLIVLILAFHCFSAYIVSQPASPPPFDLPPFDWRAFPIIDSDRWIGFDLFCAFQFLYLMQMMFFLSGLFVWPSLRRRGPRAFVLHRVVRLGVPFLLGLYLLMPLAFYPVYRVTAVDPSWSSFWSHWTALPITPAGPMWFLWFLVVLDMSAAVLYRVSPNGGRFLALLVAQAKEHPGRLFTAVICVSAVAYFPLSALFSPWKWIGWGPFEVQAALAPQYVIYFLLGLAVGAHGYERGLLELDGRLVRHWPIWIAGGFAAFMLWIIPEALIVKVPGVPVDALRAVGNVGLVLFAGAACFGLTALFFRYATAPWPIIGGISENAYGIYFFHYPVALWLQFLLLGVAIPAIGKGVFVLIATLTLSWVASVATTRLLASGHALIARGATLFGAPWSAGGRLSRTELSD